MPQLCVCVAESIPPSLMNKDLSVYIAPHVDKSMGDAETTKSDAKNFRVHAIKGLGPIQYDEVNR